MSKTFLAAALVLLAASAPAATLVEVQTRDGVTRVYSEGARARLDLHDGTYMLADTGKHTLLVVDPAQQQVLDMSRILASATRAPDDRMDIDFQAQGKGPRIAGYPTTRYRYRLGDRACGTLLASQQALRDTNLEKAMDLLQRMAARADGTAPPGTPGDDCLSAGHRVSTYAQRIGMPMRIEHRDGKLISEIIRIEKDARLPAGAFTVPAGYRSDTTGQPAGASDMGRIPPEILQRLRQTQQAE